MTTKTKVFDCVRMKRDAQQQLQAEYDQRRDEYSSYADFLNRKAEETSLWKKLHMKTSG